MKKINKSFYICFEGIDGLGKTTQIKLCLEKLQKTHSVMTSKEPSEETKQALFKEANTKLKNPDESFNMYLEDHIALQNNFISKWIEQGKIILQDRSIIYSHDCYWGDSNPYHKIIHDEKHQNCIEPDLTILFTGDPILAMKRIKSRNIEKDKHKPWSNIISLKKIQKRYLDIASKNKNTFVIILIDESLSEQEINDYIIDIINHRLKKHIDNE